MSEDDKDEIKLKLLFLVNILMLMFVIFMMFKLVESNNEMTLWMVEHGRLK